MAAETDTVILEADKLRLVEYLLERTRTEITGRSGADIWEGKPFRLVFGGVLQPLRTGPAGALRVGSLKNSIGLDFRVECRPDTPISIEVDASWAVYYPVRPSFEIARLSNAPGRRVDKAASPEPASESDAPPNGVTPAPGGQEIIPSAASAGQGEEGNAPTNGVTPAPIAQQIILPVTWRRKQVAVSRLAIACARDRSRTEVGADEIQAAFDLAKAEIAQDPEIWRHLDKPGNQSRMLSRSSLDGPTQYEAVLREVVRLAPAVECPPWAARISLDTRPEPGNPDILRVRVLLANWTPQPPPRDVLDPGVEERNLFDAHLRVKVNGGGVKPFKFLLAPEDYRAKPLMDAKGVNCVARIASDADATLVTETLPVFRQPLLRTRDLGAVAFSALEADSCVPTLEGVGTAMRAFESEWDRYLAGPDAQGLNPDERRACSDDRESFRQEVGRYFLGLECLRRDPQLAKAFRLANAAFKQLGQGLPKPIRAWRAFQIGFIVSQLPSLSVRNLPDRNGNDEHVRALTRAFGEVGVLWFPTGGGKTEAYLGLLAIALLFDRLRGRERGVTAWMRFPLRMLSLQQLERLARVIAQLNLLRATDASLGKGDPFAMGYFVGNTNTPNAIDEKDMPRYERDADLRERARVLRKCPYCGAQVSVRALRAEWRLAHVCENATCFSNVSPSLGKKRGSLPLYVVDTEIYRYLPSVLVGTVDKLAIISRNRFMHLLLRGPRQECPDHGYCAFDECVESWSASCKRTKSKLARVERHRDPGLSLLIQDELHLLEAELGTFNGHYEGLLQRIGRADCLPPKVLAATATIEAYDSQAFHLYLSPARRFPQPAWRQAESFYATALPPQVRRIYVGVPFHTRAVEDCATRILTLYWRELRRLQAAPRDAAAVMKRPEASDDDIRAVLRLYDFTLGYVNRKATAGALQNRLPQVDRVLEAAGLRPVRGMTLTGDNRIEDVGATLERVQREQEIDTQERLDAVFATSLISHGVDLERINMMIMAGVPSRYAEYIQSSSRCARANPGVVFTCLDTGSPRDTSQYEFFQALHENLDRLVEAVAINRFASFAPRKTVPGLLMGLLLCEYSPNLFGSGIGRSLDNLKAAKIALGLEPTGGGTSNGCVPQADLLSAILEVIGTGAVGPFVSASQAANVRAEVEQVFADQIGVIGRSLERQTAAALNPLTSFRDVDEGIDFGSVDSATLIAQMQGARSDER